MAPLTSRIHALCLEHLADPGFGLERIAEALSQTGRHVRRQLVAETGEGPQALLRRLRMEHAQRLLTEHGVTVAEAARAVGYRDTSAFRRAFRAVVGHNPGAASHPALES